MSKNLPQVRIRHSRFLEPVCKAYFLTVPNSQNVTIPTHEEMEIHIEEYKDEWGRSGDGIMESIASVLGLDFYQNTIDVYVARNYSGAFSDPMVIGMMSREGVVKPDVFVDILTHEILHRVFTDNASHIRFGLLWQKMFPNEEMLVRNHIFLHAVHAHIYTNILKDTSRMERNITRHSIHPPYKRAWDIVAERGFANLIEELRKQY